MINKVDSKTKMILTISMFIALAFGAYFLRNYFVMIALAAIIAYLFNPAYKWLLIKTNNRRGLSSGLTFLLFVVTVTIPLAIILAITVNQAIQLSSLIKNLASSTGSVSQTIPELLHNINIQLDKIPTLGPDTVQLSKIEEWLRSNSASLIGNTVSYAAGIAGGMGDLITRSIIFIFIFLSILKKQDTLISNIKKLNPLGSKATDMYLDKMGAMTTAMVKGQFLIAATQGLVDALLLQIAGIHYFIFWFIFITFLSIIPLGGGIIVIPIGVVMILTGHIWQGILLIAGHILIVTNIDNVMRPRFVPKSAKLDSALLIMSVFSGIAMFGLLGIVIGPVIMIVIVTTVDTYLKFMKQQKAKSIDSSSLDKAVKN